MVHGNFAEALRNHWCQYVPAVYSAQMDADAGREERRAKRLLFRPMETFLCGGEPEAIFKELKQLDNPPQICGRVFKMGEPTYSCRLVYFYLAFFTVHCLVFLIDYVVGNISYFLFCYTVFPGK